ncbi:MAG: BlaI/MecI/CopY family transcriptional regulator [Longimicrobiales bacterium]
MKELHRLTELQIALLDTIWRRGEATVRQVFEAQEDTLGMARKTVGTVLRRLERQGILEHREERRQYIYRARITRDDVRDAVLTAAADALFSGSREALAQYALKLDRSED